MQPVSSPSRPRPVTPPARPRPLPVEAIAAEERSINVPAPSHKPSPWANGSAVFQAGHGSESGNPEDRKGFLGRIQRDASGSYAVHRWFHATRSYRLLGTRKTYSEALSLL